jgi:hypothetical protein
MAGFLSVVDLPICKGGPMTINGMRAKDPSTNRVYAK